MFCLSNKLVKKQIEEIQENHIQVINHLNVKKHEQEEKYIQELLNIRLENEKLKKTVETLENVTKNQKRKNNNLENNICKYRLENASLKKLVVKPKSRYEKMVYKQLKRRKINFIQEYVLNESDRNTVKHIDFYENKPYDFYIKKFNLIIEVDGSHHDSELQTKRDIKYANIASICGYKFERISYKYRIDTQLNEILSKHYKYFIENKRIK